MEQHSNQVAIAGDILEDLVIVFRQIFKRVIILIF